MKTFNNFVEVIETAAADFPNQVAYTFLEDDSLHEISISYSDLAHKAKAIAAKLQQQIKPGDRAILVYPPGIDLIVALFGCFYAGVVAILVQPPKTLELLHKLQLIINSAQSTWCLTSSDLHDEFNRLRTTETSDLGKLNWFLTDNIDEHFSHYTFLPLESTHLAFLQFTSGSTGNPKGVMVSHGNIIANCHALIECLGFNRETNSLSWLPPYHDLGLMLGILCPFYVGSACWLISPTTFIKQPIIWLRLISKYRITLSGGPNFAYDLCSRRVKEIENDNLDLSCWKLAINGAEPVRAKTLATFYETFAANGFRFGSFFIGYGLAEATLVVSCTPLGQQPMIQALNKTALKQGKIVYTTTDAADAKLLPSVGRVASSYELVIADPESYQRCTSDQLGEIWIKGPSVTQGYWQRRDETNAQFNAYLSDGSGPFLRSGDLGFFKGDELFVTGRMKDLIILRGHNYYPSDLEFTIEETHPDLRAGSVVAFSIDENEKEQLVILIGVRSFFRFKDDTTMYLSIQENLAKHHMIRADIVALIPKKEIKKTTSGKLQRRPLQKLFVDGKLSILKIWHENSDKLLGKINDTHKLISEGSENHDKSKIMENWIREWLTTKINSELKELNLNIEFAQLGLDSVLQIELGMELEKHFGVRLNAIHNMSRLTIKELFQQLNDQILNPCS